MKKFSSIILYAVLFLALNGCYAGSHFDAAVLEVGGSSLQVEPDEDAAERKSSDRFTIPKNTSGIREDIEPGDSIRIYYNGEILETYPAQLSEVIRAEILEESE